MDRTLFSTFLRLLLLLALLVSYVHLISVTPVHAASTSDYATINKQFQRVSVQVFINGENKRWNGWKNKERLLIPAELLKDLQINLTKNATDQLTLVNDRVKLTIHTKKKSAQLNDKKNLQNVPIWVDRGKYVLDAKWIVNVMGIRWTATSNDRFDVRLPKSDLKLTFKGIQDGDIITTDRLQFSIITEPLQLRDYHLHPINVANEGHVQLSVLNLTTGKIITRNVFQSKVVFNSLPNGQYQMTGTVNQNNQEPYFPLVNASINFTVNFVATPKPTVAPTATPTNISTPVPTVAPQTTNQPGSGTVTATPSAPGTSATPSTGSVSPTPNSNTAQPGASSPPPTSTGPSPTVDPKVAEQAAKDAAEALRQAELAKEAALRQAEQERQAAELAKQAAAEAEAARLRKEQEAQALLSVVNLTGVTLSKEVDASIDLFINPDSNAIEFSNGFYMGAVDQIIEFKNKTGATQVIEIVNYPISVEVANDKSLVVQFKKPDMYTAKHLTTEVTATIMIN